MKLLLTTVASLCLLLGVHAQTPQIGFCNTYQTTPAFNQAFIAKMQANEEGFSFLLTSGPNLGCKKLTFFPNGTYFYDYVGETNNHVNASGPYRMVPFSFSNPATIEMSLLPYGELGSIVGTISYNILHADDDLLVLLSCVNIGLIRSQQLHILVPQAKSSSISIEEVNATVQEMEVPLADYLEEVQQICKPGLRQLNPLGWIRRIFRKLGINLPFYLSHDDASLDPLLYALVTNPNIQFPESNALVPHAFRQDASVFSSQASPPSSVVPPFVYPQLPFIAGFQHPYFVSQQVGPQVMPSVQFGLQQFQTPVQAFSKIPAPTDSFHGQSSQFFGTPSSSSLKYTSRNDQSNSVPFFLANRPPQPIQEGER